MVGRSTEFDKGFRDELERMGVIPPLVTPAPPPPRPMPKQRPVPKPATPRPVPPLVAGSTSKGITAPPRSLLTPGLVVQQSRPSSPPPATPPAVETTTPQPATPVVTPTATPVVTPPATPTPTPTDTPIATPETPDVPAPTPHTRAASQMGVAVPEGSTEAAPTVEGYRQVRTPDGSLWVVDAQGRLARPGSLTRPAPLGNTTSQQSVESTLTTADARLTAAISDQENARGILMRPRAAYTSDAAYETAQNAAQAQLDRAQTTIDTESSQTTAVTDLQAQQTEVNDAAQATTDYRNAPIESGAYAGQTTEQLQDRLFFAETADHQYQNRLTNPGASISIAGSMGFDPSTPPEGWMGTAEQWRGIVGNAPAAPPGWEDGPEAWAYLIFTSRMLTYQGIDLSDDDGSWINSVLDLSFLDQARQYNVGMMGEDVHAQINGLDRPNITAATGAILPGTNPFNTWALDPANQGVVNEVYDNGYTGPSGEHFTGGEAVWEYYASEQSRWTRVMQDLLLDPLNFVSLLTGGGNLAVRTGARLVERGGASVFPGRVIQAGGQIARAPGLIVEGAPDAVLGELGGLARVAADVSPVTNNRVTRTAGTGIRRGIGWLRDPSSRTIAETGGQEAAQAGARAYDATGRVAPPPGLPGPVAPEASVAPGNRVRFVTSSTPTGQTPTDPDIRIVADVATTSRPRHIVFRSEDGTDTVVPVGQRVTPNADTTTRPRHIVVRTADGQEAEFPLPEPDVTTRPMHVVIQHADGTETTIPTDLALAPNADVTTRPRPVPMTTPAPLSTVPGDPVSTSPPRAPLPAAIPTSPPTVTAPVSVSGTPLPETPVTRVGATQDEAIAQSSPRTATPDDTPYEQPATVMTQRVPARNSRISVTDYPALPTSTARQYDSIVLADPDYSASGRYRRNMFLQDEATGDFRHRYDSRQGNRVPEDWSPVIRDKPLPANPTRAEVTQAENFVTLIDEYVARHGGPETQPSAKAAASLRRDITTADGLNRQLDALDNGRPAPRQRATEPNVTSNTTPDAAATGSTTDQLRDAFGRLKDVSRRNYADAGAQARAQAEELANITRLMIRLAAEVASDGIGAVSARLARLGDEGQLVATSLRNHVRTATDLDDSTRQTLTQLTDQVMSGMGAPEAPGSPVRVLTPGDPSAAPVGPQATPQAATGPAGPVPATPGTRSDPVTTDPTSIGGQTVRRVLSSGDPIVPTSRTSRPVRRAADTAARRQQLIDYNAAARRRRTEQVAARRAGTPVPEDLPPFQYQPDRYTTPTPDSFEDTPGGYSRYAVIGNDDRATLGRTFTRTTNPAYGQTVGASYVQARREVDELQRLGALNTARPGSLSAADLKRIRKLIERYGDVGTDVQTAEGAAERFIVDLFVQEAGLPLNAMSRTRIGRVWKGLITWTSRNLVSNILDAPRRTIADMVGDSFQLALTGNFLAIPNQFRYIKESYAATVNGASLMETPYAQRLRQRGVIGRESGYGTTFVGNDRSTFGALEDIARPRRRGLNRRGRDWINALDSARRLATAEGVWRREAEGLDKATLGQIMREADRSGLRLTDEDWRDELRRSLGWGLDDYSPTDLYYTVRTRGLTDGLKPGEAHTLADRVARSYADRVLDLHRQSVSEVNRALFSYKYTNADELASNVLAFHYYQTRSAKLYVQQAIKHPALASNYYRTMQGLEAYGEEKGFPPSLMGFMRLLNGPVGLTMFFSPTVMWDTFNAAKAMADQSGESTWFERMMAFPFVPGLNVPLSTVVNLAGYLPNGLAPDPTGLTSERQFGLAIVNVLNSYFNPDGQVIGDPVADVTSWVRSHTSGFLPGSDRVNSQDSTDYADSQVRALVIDAAEAEYGIPWDQFSDEQRAAVTAAQWDPSSPWYRTAYDQWSTGNAVLETGQMFTPLQPRGRITTDTEIRAAANPQGDIAPDDPYNDERGDLIPSDGIIAKRQGLSRMAGDEIGATQPLTPEESRLYQRQQTAYDTRDGIDAGSEEAATLASSADGYRASTRGSGPTGQGDGALDIWIYVAYADDISGPITIQGRTYTPERIAELTQDERFALADGLIDEFDLTADLEAARAAQDAYVAEHPEYAVFQDWAGRVRDYAGPGGAGIEGYWSDATTSNPAAAAYYADLEQRYGDDIPGAMLTSTDAYLATRGVQLDRFDGNPPETENGRPGGADPSVVVGTNVNAPTATAATSSYAPETPADVVKNLLQAEAEYTADVATFDEFSQQTYGAPFDELSPYAQDSVTALMRNAGIGMPAPSSLLREYVEWQQRDLAAGGDGSRDRFAAWRIQQKATEDEAIAPWYRDAGLTSDGDMLPAAD